MESLRLRWIERLCRLPEAQLAEVETLLHQLAQQSTSHPAPQTAPPCWDSTGPPIPLAPRDPPEEQPAPHRDWPHAPLHRLSEHGTFIVTASTLHKQHFFRGPERLTLLQDKLLGLAREYPVHLEAWAVFSNHYHFLAHVTGTSNPLADLITRLHLTTAKEVNQWDDQPGRAVWFNYWDTQLTFEKSYLARLNYVHQNAVKHGLVRQASAYPWCSAAWFERTATAAQVATIYGFKMDRVRVDDDYEPVV